MKRTAFRDGTQYLLLEARQHGRQEFPERVVSMNRLGLGPELQALSRQFSVQFRSNAMEKNGHGYIGNITWEQGLTLNQILGVETPTLREMWDVYGVLKQGINGKRVYTGLGKKVGEKQIRAWYDELFGKREPLRAMWIDAHFVENKGHLYLEQRHCLNDRGRLYPLSIKRMLKHVDSDGYVDYSSVNWQGVAVRTSEESEIYQHVPQNNCVAGFCANSGGASLECNGDPTVSDSNLGVLSSALRERAPFL